MTTMTGKIVLLKDQSNLNGKMKAGRMRNDLDTAGKQLTEKYDWYMQMYASMHELQVDVDVDVCQLSMMYTITLKGAHAQV